MTKSPNNWGGSAAFVVNELVLQVVEYDSLFIHISETKQERCVCLDDVKFNVANRCRDRNRADGRGRANTEGRIHGSFFGFVDVNSALKEFLVSKELTVPCS